MYELIFATVEYTEARDVYFKVLGSFSYFSPIRLLEFTTQNTGSTQCGRALVLPHNYPATPEGWGQRFD